MLSLELFSVPSSLRSSAKRSRMTVDAASRASAACQTLMAPAHSCSALATERAASAVASLAALCCSSRAGTRLVRFSSRDSASCQSTAWRLASTSRIVSRVANSVSLRASHSAMRARACAAPASLGGSCRRVSKNCAKVRRGSAIATRSPLMSVAVVIFASRLLRCSR